MITSANNVVFSLFIEGSIQSCLAQKNARKKKYYSPIKRNDHYGYTFTYSYTVYTNLIPAFVVQQLAWNGK